MFVGIGRFDPSSKTWRNRKATSLLILDGNLWDSGIFWMISGDFVSTANPTSSNPSTHPKSLSFSRRENKRDSNQ
jgi:hypothetical protein